VGFDGENAAFTVLQGITVVCAVFRVMISCVAACTEFSKESNLTCMLVSDQVQG